MNTKIIKYKKKGYFAIITPIVVLLCAIFILFLTVFIINVIKPFILYEKLDSIANKYMFVIERYGYLSQEEKISLEKEIQKEGFDLKNIVIIYPDSKKLYGEVIEFCIKYKFDLKLPLLGNEISNNKRFDLTIKKHSISKR